jgi:hypothetical protein
MEALNLARDVDTAVYVADEMGRLGGGQREAGSGKR